MPGAEGLTMNCVVYVIVEEGKEKNCHMCAAILRDVDQTSTESMVYEVQILQKCLMHQAGQYVNVYERNIFRTYDECNAVCIDRGRGFKALDVHMKHMQEWVNKISQNIRICDSESEKRHAHHIRKYGPIPQMAVSTDEDSVEERSIKHTIIDFLNQKSNQSETEQHAEASNKYETDPALPERAKAGSTEEYSFEPVSDSANINQHETEEHYVRRRMNDIGMDGEESDSSSGMQEMYKKFYRSYLKAVADGARSAESAAAQPADPALPQPAKAVAEGAGSAESAAAQPANPALPQPAKAVAEGTGSAEDQAADPALPAKAAAANNASPGLPVPEKEGPRAAGSYAKAAAGNNASPGPAVPARTGPKAEGMGQSSSNSKPAPSPNQNGRRRTRGNSTRNAFGPQNNYIV